MKHTCKYCQRDIIPLKNGNSLDAGADCLAKINSLDTSQKFKLINELNIPRTESEIDSLQEFWDVLQEWKIGNLKEAVLYVKIRESMMFEDIANALAKKLFPKSTAFNKFEFMGTEDYKEYLSFIFQDSFINAKVDIKNNLFNEGVYVFTVNRKKKFNIQRGA